MALYQLPHVTRREEAAVQKHTQGQSKFLTSSYQKQRASMGRLAQCIIFEGCKRDPVSLDVVTPMPTILKFNLNQPSCAKTEITAAPQNSPGYDIYLTGGLALNYSK
jgi:hypothetical protein